MTAQVPAEMSGLFDPRNLAMMPPLKRKTWEWGPQMSTVWKEDGSFDWWEVDAYLRKLAALDPNSRLHLRFTFGAPPAWSIAKHPDELVQVISAQPGSVPRPSGGGMDGAHPASFASKPYWEACEKAARESTHAVIFWSSQAAELGRRPRLLLNTAKEGDRKE